MHIRYFCLYLQMRKSRWNDFFYDHLANNRKLERIILSIFVVVAKKKITIHGVVFRLLLYLDVLLYSNDDTVISFLIHKRFYFFF